MKKKKLFAIIALSAIFGLASCDEENKPIESTEVTTSVIQDANADVAYSFVYSEISRDAFDEKLKITTSNDYRGDYKVYSIMEPDLVFSLIYKDGEKHSYVKSVGGSSSHLEFYQFYEVWVHVADINIKNDKTTMYIEESIVSNLWNSLNLYPAKYGITPDLSYSRNERLLESVINSLLDYHNAASLWNGFDNIGYDYVHFVDVVFEEKHVDVEKVSFTYKNQLLVNAEAYEKDDNNNWAINEKLEFFYDEIYNLNAFNYYEALDGQLIWATKSEYKDGIWYKKEATNRVISDFQIYERIESSYRGDDIIEEEYFKRVDDQLVLNKKEEYLYDDSRNLSAKMIYSLEDGILKLRAKEEYEENEEKNSYSIIKYNYENEEWVLQSKEEYIFNDNDKLLSWTSSNYINDSWVINKKEEYTYASSGNFASEVFSSYSNGELCYGQKMEFTYDENEPIDIEIDSEYIDSWKYTKKIERKYEKLGYITQHLRFSSSIKPRSISYEDDRGSLLEEITSVYVWDESGNGSWVYSKKAEYSYDENNKKEEKYYKYENDSWVEITLDEYYHI